MLDSETKRRIDTCRDILVGKVPDPKSQVEQITVSLIYKFMDDMDLQSEEMGGKRKFFTGDFERYRWAKLVAPGVSGQDMLNTYSEALTKMVENDKLPALFRSIFRNAHLPYRDPETLRSFLREINAFTYDHSEKLGDAFEYLLSVLGSQGDAGQFRTPRHVIDFMVDIIAPKKDEVILDPACGTAGFLISAYKHILKANSTNAAPENGRVEGVDAAELALESPMRFSGDLLSAKDRERLARNIKGYDISPDMVRLSLVNLYLHGFADPKVEEYDTLTSEDKWTEMADVILANPPFMSPKGGIKPHTRFKVESKRSEVLFVDYMAEHLTPNGRAAIVVPEGIIFQSQTAYVQLRKMLVENFLAAVISLPAGVFNPYSGVKTSILILDRVAAKACDHVTFFKIENDGFALGAQRRAVKGSQLPQVKAELSAWLKRARVGGGEILESSIGFVVQRQQVAGNGEFNLSAERYSETVATHSAWPMAPLGNVASILNGYAFRSENYVDTGIRVIRITNVQKGFIEDTQPKFYPLDSREPIERFKLLEGDLLISLTGNVGRVGRLPSALMPAALNQRVACIRPLDARTCTDYLFHLLNHSAFEENCIRASSGVAQLNLSSKWLGDYAIPVPPLEVQREIVAEIEGYQKVIDGARAVIDNYRPHFHRETGWPSVELGSVCDLITDGTHRSPENHDSGDRLYITSKNVRGGYLDLRSVTYISEAEHREIYRRCPVRQGDVLYTKDGANTGLAAINTIEEEFSLLSSVALIRGAPGKLLNAYLVYWLNSASGREHMLSKVSGVAITRLTLTKISSAEIPLPPIAVQEAIAAEIATEQALVNGNRDLIARFEKKIDAAIARVWGEAKAAAEAA